LTKIAFITHLFPSDNAPASRFAFEQVKAIQSRGVDVRLIQPLPWVPFFLRWNSKWNVYYRSKQEHSFRGVKVERIAYPHPPGRLLRFLAPFFLVVPLLISLRKMEFDAIHAQPFTPDGFAAVVVGFLLKKPVVVCALGSDVHTYPNYNKFEKWLAQITIENADKVVAVSDNLSEQTLRLGMLKNTIKTIYMGVDIELFSPTQDKVISRSKVGLPPDAIIALSVGSLTEDKGVKEIISAFSTISKKYPTVRLIAVGEGPLLIDLLRLNLDLGGKVIFTPGFVSSEVVRDYMQAADILIHASHAEGLPNVVLEAMAVGLPVIATDVGGTREAVIDGFTGFLVKCRNWEQIVRPFQILIEDENLRRTMGREAQQFVSQRFSWGQCADQWLEVYQTLTSK
jgi:teichuronic acid biosynthesis glycosyltransferase TuaC